MRGRRDEDIRRADASPAKVVVAYHERTKHHFHRYAASLGCMDWATQPDPFRRYPGADLVRLPLPKPGRPLPYWQLYALARDPDKLAALQEVMRREFRWQHLLSCPLGLPLYLLQEGDCRALATTVSCDQHIAGDGAFSLGMIADYMDSLTTYGAAFYRNLFWEAGMVGQVLYLEAEETGIRATGIGCYFDDPVHEAFGIISREWQSFYHFTVGGQVEETRLTTSPAYGLIPSGPGRAFDVKSAELIS
jgi:hypothetical protein